MVPTTIQECLQEFKTVLNAKTQMEILKMHRDDLIGLHHNLGLWIRNNWGLWQKESDLYKHMYSLGYNHPDEMSQAIIVEYWNKLNNLPSELKSFNNQAQEDNEKK